MAVPTTVAELRLRCGRWLGPKGRTCIVVLDTVAPVGPADEVGPAGGTGSGRNPRPWGSRRRGGAETDPSEMYRPRPGVEMVVDPLPGESDGRWLYTCSCGKDWIVRSDRLSEAYRLAVAEGRRDIVLGRDLG